MSKIGQAKKKILHFYCYTCKDYELKASPHYGAQKARFAKRRKAEGRSNDDSYNNRRLVVSVRIGLTPERCTTKSTTKPSSKSMAIHRTPN